MTESKTKHLSDMAEEVFIPIADFTVGVWSQSQQPCLSQHSDHTALESATDAESNAATEDELPNESEAAVEDEPTIPLDAETKHSDNAALDPTTDAELEAATEDELPNEKEAAQRMNQQPCLKWRQTVATTPLWIKEKTIQSMLRSYPTQVSRQPCIILGR